MDRSKYCISAFKSNKSIESNTIRLCHDLEVYIHEHENQKTKKSLEKYLARMLQILKNNHKLSKTENLKVKIGQIFEQYNTIELVLVNITVFDLEMAGVLFHIFILSIDTPLESYFVHNSQNLGKLLITPVSSLDLDLLSGQFFRDLLKHPSISAAFLTLEIFNGLIEAACNQMFEIQSDACVSLRSLLTGPDSSSFINNNSYQILNGLYSCSETNYYVKRSSLKLLYSLLSIEENQNFSYNFVENKENLKYAMRLMREETHCEIKIEGFLIFSQICKIVLMREDKDHLDAYKIILKNKGMLIKYLSKFQQEREDNHFHTIRSQVISFISDLP